LHIGLPKTGTTSIQFVLSEHRKTLLDMGIVYPSSPGSTGHALLAASILDRDIVERQFFPTVWEGMTPATRIERFRREFHQEMGNLSEHIRMVVMSAEHCGAFLNTKAAIDNLAGMLRPYFDCFRIIAYLRRQDLFEASIYNERLRIGELGEPKLPLARLQDLWTYDYDSILNAWASTFGDQAIVARVYEREAMRNGDVVDDFLMTCGINLEIAANDRNRARNTSVSLAGQRLLLAAGQRLTKKMGTPALEGRVWRQLGIILSESLTGEGWLPTRAEALQFMSQFAAGNEAVRRRFLPERNTLFTEDFDKLPATPVELDSEALVSAAIDALLFAVEASGREQARDSLRLARMLRQDGDLTVAKKRLLHDAIWCDPQLVEARLELAKALMVEGDLIGAREHARLAQSLEPDSPGVRNLLHRLRQLQQAKAAGPEHSPIHSE
jgi:hypothetical protein